MLDVWIQHGPPRTATTLLFHTMCAAMFLLHMNEPDNVQCNYVGDTNKFDEILKENKYNVIKIHDSKLISSGPENEWIFSTAKDYSDHNIEKWQSMTGKNEALYHRKVKYVQVLSGLKVSGWRGVVHDISTLLNLSVESSDMLLDHMRYWDILRICCGVQQSVDNVNRMKGAPSNTMKHPFGSALYPACEIYNLDELETNFMNTEIMKKFGKYSPTIRSVSLQDGELTGSYCSRTNEGLKSGKIAIMKSNKGA